MNTKEQVEKKVSELRQKKKRMKYQMERFPIKNLAPEWEGDDYNEEGDELAKWLNYVAREGFVYRDALPTEDGFVVIVERKA